MIIIKNTSKKGLIDAIVMWYGSSASIPSGWELYEEASYNYIIGASDETDIDIVSTGSLTHIHAVNTTNSTGAHTHPGSVGSTSSSSSSTSFGSTSGTSLAAGGHTHSSRSASAASGGAHTHTVPDTNSASSQPPSISLYWLKAITNAEEEIDTIVNWSHDAGDIPSGWYQCDGTNGTIDLTAYFVYGAGEDSDVLDTVVSGSHVHTVPDTDDSSSHTHSFTASISGNSTVSNGFAAGAVTSATGNHSHDASGTTGADGIHSHTVVDTDDETLLPPTMLLYFIQKRA